MHAAPSTNIRFNTMRTGDAEAQAAGLSAWDQRYEQLSAGRFEGVVEDARVGDVQIFRERANQTLLQSGRPGSGTVTVAAISRPARHAWFCGHALREACMIVTSGDAPFELVADAGMSIAAVSVGMEALGALARTIHGARWEGLAHGPMVLDPSDGERTALVGLLDASLHVARERAATLDVPAARHRLELSLTEAVVDCLGRSDDRSRLPGGATSHRRIVAAAREYMRHHADEAITVIDLCAATGVSRRSLQYAFEEVLQLSPVAYLRVMRLNRVRGELTRRRPDTVGDVAARWGFWHLSRFAAEYRTLFGELPSATRLRI